MAVKQDDQHARISFPTDCPACIPQNPSQQTYCNLCEGRGFIIFETTETELETAFLEYLGVFDSHTPVSNTGSCPFHHASDKK